MSLFTKIHKQTGDGMISKKWTIEDNLYTLAFLLALGIRLFMLGAPALTDFEAGWANQAFGLAHGQSVALGAQPFYVLFTGLLFRVLSSSNFLARLLPALAGSLLVFVPFFFRHRLSRTIALIAAFGLALDPLLVAISRTAGDIMPVISFTLLALGAFYSMKPALAGLLGGLALLSGPAVLPGMIGLALIWGGFILAGKLGIVFSEGSAEPENFKNAFAQRVRIFLLVLAGTLFFGGTLFMLYPQGLSALGATLPAYFGGWTSQSGIPLLRLVAALIIYQPLALILGVAGVLLSWRRGPENSWIFKGLCIWMCLALALALVYPARQIGDLAWVIIPLWALAAREIELNLLKRGEAHNHLLSLGQALLIIILIIFSWVNLVGFSQGVILTRNLRLNSAVVLVGTLAMVLLTTLLVSLGWSWSVARRGLVWAIIGILGVYQLSGVWGGLRLDRNVRQELWVRYPVVQESDLLLETLHDLSEWNTGQKTSLDIVVLVDSPSLRWVLRDWNQVRFASELTADDLPATLITYKDQATPRLTDVYRGQDFAWDVFQGWQGIIPVDFMRWLAFRQAPTQSIQVILWARADLFPEGVLSTQGGTAPNP